MCLTKLSNREFKLFVAMIVISVMSSAFQVWL